MVRARVFITGDVIGVGFRSWVLAQAKNLQLTGFVRNVHFPHKGVEAVFQGDKKQVDEMLVLCKKGPDVSWVKKVEVITEETSGELIGFSIQR